MHQRNRVHRPVLVAALLLAVAIQIPLLYFLKEQTSGSTELTPLPPKRQLRGRLVPKRPEPPKKPAEPEKLDGQVVTVPEPDKPKKPKETNHLAKYDTDVKQEQKARHRSRPTRVRKPSKVSVRKPSKLQSRDSESPSPTKLEKKPKEEQLPQARPDAPPTDRGTRTMPDPMARGRRPQLLRPGTDTDSTFQNIQTLSGQFTTDDALLDVEKEADSTLLRARSFRYWDFFNRVKERVRAHWEPATVYRQRDPTGEVYGVRDRLTVLHVTLDAEGRVVKLVAAKKSGLDFLDKEALRAFRAAGPFDNPPKGMVDEYGQIQFRFGFLFEIGSSQYRFFWKRM